MGDDALSVLQELHFTEYEAKAYLALLEKAPLTGYAVSLNSGVPRSKIYEVLGGLVERGEVMVSRESPALYTPLEPELLVRRRKRRMERSLEAAGKSLAGYARGNQTRDNIWNIAGREAILDRVVETVDRAENRILAEIWAEDAEELRPAFARAAERGVEIIVVAYGEVDFEFAQVYQHDASGHITEEYGGRWVVLSVDAREVVAGTVSLGEKSRAAWTSHPGLAIPITEVIVHDLYIMEILAKHRHSIEESFGPNMEKLRRRFNLDSLGRTFADAMRFWE